MVQIPILSKMKLLARPEVMNRVVQAVTLSEIRVHLNVEGTDEIHLSRDTIANL